MNIFALDKSPIKSAQYLCDCHVVKMILESAQLLATHLQLHGYERGDMPGMTHTGHPCRKWVSENPANARWLYEHFVALLDEYSYRYNKKHSYERYRERFNQIFTADSTNATAHAQAMPQEYKDKDSIEAYRKYYRSKQHTMKKFMVWTKRPVPDWFIVDEGSNFRRKAS